MVNSVADLINLWPAPSLTNFAADLGVRVEHAGAMKHRKSIPPAHWEKLVAVAAARGIDVNLEMLASLAARRRTEAAPQQGEAAA